MTAWEPNLLHSRLDTNLGGADIGGVGHVGLRAEPDAVLVEREALTEVVHHARAGREGEGARDDGSDARDGVPVEASERGAGPVSVLLGFRPGRKHSPDSNELNPDVHAERVLKRSGEFGSGRDDGVGSFGVHVIRQTDGLFVTGEEESNLLHHSSESASSECASVERAGPD